MYLGMMCNVQNVQNGFQTIPDVCVKGFEPIKMYFEVERGFRLAWHKNPLTLACEAQTHFRERSDDRKCICASQATLT